jgi:hypothetical protein
MKIKSDLHGDMQRKAEMTFPALRSRQQLGQTDALPAAAANAHPEGEVAVATAIVPTVRTGCYTQILVQDFSVTDTNEAVNSAGRASEIAYQKAKYTKALANDIEYALIVNTACVSGASATARQTKGALGWIVTNVTTGTTASAITEALFNDNLALIYAQGGQEPYTALMGMVQKRAASAFTGNNTRFQEIEKAKIQSTVNVYESDAGKVTFKLHRIMGTAAPGSVLILGDMDLWNKMWLRQKGWEMLARVGSYQHWHIESELVLESRQEKGSGKITGLKTT